MFAFRAPQQQIDFSVALAQARHLFLQEALGKTVAGLNLPDIDRELAALAPTRLLSALAMHGLRGELVFALPGVLRANPRLLAYYRLLLGYSQKEFFTTATGAARFKLLEAQGKLTKTAAADLEALCAALNQVAAELVDGVGLDRVSRQLLDDLTLLTLGPQLRGRANVRRGDAAIVKVFDLIHAIVKKSAKASDPGEIRLRNAARRTVLIEFASDPDIIIREQMAGDSFRNIIAIEIKGGTDYSNIHNRIGEAEKSHRKARADEYTECWTVVNVDRLDMQMARRESPSTDRFYSLAALLDPKTSEHRDFKNRIVSLTGIRG
jgi:XcyI-like restriction endonuclease